MSNDWTPKPGDQVRVIRHVNPMAQGVVGVIEDLPMPEGIYGVWLTFPQYLPDGSAMVAVQVRANQLEPL